MVSEEYERSSGNVFADLGHPDPETALAKAKLAARINSTIEEQGWSDEQASTELGLEAEAFGALTRGRLSAFSTDELLSMLTRLNLDVDINVGPNISSIRRARIAVHSQREPVSASSQTGNAETGNAETVRFE